MTENMAGRGEGLADRLTESIWAISDGQHPDKDTLRNLIRNILAAAPTGTAPTQAGMPDFIHKIVSDWYSYNPFPSTPVSETQHRCAGELKKAWESTRALATPSPQAPQEQCKVFPTTSAREQSSATASSNLSVAARAKALAEFTLYFASNYPGPHTIINDPYWHAPKLFKAAEYAIRAGATQEQPAGSALLCPRCGCASKDNPFDHRRRLCLTCCAGFDIADATDPGSPRKVGEDGAGEKYERTHSRAWVNAWNAALEEVCGLVAVNGSELDFGPFSIGHNPKRVQQEHTMIVELIRALKHPVPALRSSSVPVGEQKQEDGV